MDFRIVHSTLSDVSVPTFLAKLRSRTAGPHAALEQNPIAQSLSSAQVSRNSYIHYLQVMQGVVSEMEDVLVPVLSDLVPDIHTRKKADWIGEDLSALNTGENPFPKFPFVVSEKETQAYAMGAYYVLEGSMLGGRVMLKSLPMAATGHFTRYFFGYGSETGAKWQGFLHIMSSYAMDQACEEIIIRGAENTFAVIHKYFNDCAAYAAERHCKP